MNLKTIMAKVTKKVIESKTVKTEVKAVVNTEVCSKCAGIGRLPPHEFYHIESCDACKGTGLTK